MYNIIKHIKDAFERSYRNDTQTYLNIRNTLFGKRLSDCRSKNS